jgi:hypothetical protein
VRRKGVGPRARNARSPDGLSWMRHKDLFLAHHIHVLRCGSSAPRPEGGSQRPFSPERLPRLPLFNWPPVLRPADSEQRRRRNSRASSGEWSGAKSRARSRAYSRICDVTASGSGSRSSVEPSVSSSATSGGSSSGTSVGATSRLDDAHRRAYPLMHQHQALLVSASTGCEHLSRTLIYEPTAGMASHEDVL